jgi:biotin carboxyl carrier protein
MKKFQLSVNGNWYEVEIRDLDESPISVLVDGELYEVELGAEIPAAQAVEGARPERSRRVREESAVSAPAPALEASRPALRRALHQTQGAAQDAVAAAGEVIAPMPGKILAVKVGVGDRVQRRDVLCILEAMKMENEIMAPAGGAVKEARVAAGQDVLYGDVLFVIE